MRARCCYVCPGALLLCAGVATLSTSPQTQISRESVSSCQGPEPLHGRGGGSGPLSLLFDTSDFPPRWHCGNWTGLHGWVHIVSDLLIFGAYAAIPVALLYFIRRRRDAPFPKLFWLFGAFIFACGSGHLIEATIFWHPWYRLSAAMKVFTAIISWATVVALLPILPKALALPGLAKVNQDLQREIGERRRAEQSLEQSNRQLHERNDEMRQFIYTISHDLKSPLVTTLGFIGMLREDLGPVGDEVNQSMDHIESAARRMTRLIDDVLQLSRIGRVSDNPEPLDSGAVAREVWDGLASQAIEAHARLDVLAPMPVVTMDRQRLIQVWENLLTNAIKYGCPGPSSMIQVAGGTIDGEVRLSVRDFGEGIAPEHHERIFELFHRLHHDNRGTGVGLAIVRRIAGLYHGRAWVESSPGNGATFWFAVPIAGCGPSAHS